MLLCFSVPQTLILSRACGFDINWAEVLLSQYVILGHAHYLQEYLQHLQINDNIIENTVKGWVLLLTYKILDKCFFYFLLNERSRLRVIQKLIIIIFFSSFFKNYLRVKNYLNYTNII